MAVKVASVEFDLITNVAKYADDMGRAARATEDSANKIAKSMKHAEDGFKSFANGVKSSLALGALTAGLIELGKNLDDQEKGLAQVQASLRSTGGVAGVTEKSILDLADSMKKLTAVDDDAIVAADALLLTFTKVGKEIFPEATRAIVDMSAKLGTDLKSATLQVGKALNDPIKGINALTREGVSFSAAQKDMVKNLVETGHTLDAQKLILRELNTEFGGSAAAMRDTFGGALQALQVRVGDVFQAIGGGQGLRTGIETLIVVAEKSAAVLTEMNNPATELGKQAQKFNVAMEQGLITGTAWTNALIFGFVNVGAEIQKAHKSASNFMEAYFKIMPGAGATRDMVNKALGGFGDSINAADATFKNGAANGAVPNYLKGIIDTVNEAKKKIAELHAEAAKSKPFVARDGEDGGTSSSKGAIKKLDAEKKAVAEIVEKYKLKAMQAGEVSKQQRQYNELLEEERQIQKRTLVPVQERKAAIDQLHTAYNQMIAAEKAVEAAKKEAARVKAIAAEREGLQELLDSMRQEIEETKAKKTLNESMIPIWEAERQIKEHTKKFNTENLDLQKQILEAAKQQSELIVQQKHEDALKTLKEITEEYKKEQEAAEAKVKGQENYNKLLADEKKILDDIHLSDKEKDAGIADIKAADLATRTANKAYEAQKKIVKDILSAKDSDVVKTKKLNDALKAGSINAKEYEDAVADLNNTTSKTGTLGGQLSSIFGNAFSSFISGGAKATDIVKNVGKEIANLAAKKLLLEPIGKMFDSWANNIFGAPSGGATGGGQLSSSGGAGGGGLGGLFSGIGGIFSGAKAGYNIGTQNAGMFGLPGWAAGTAGIFGGAAAGATDLIKKLLGYETGGSWADQSFIRVAERGPEMVWPGGYGSANPYLAGLNGPEMYYTGGRAGYVSNTQDTMAMFGGYASGSMQGGGDRYGAGLADIDRWQQQLLTGMDGAGKSLGYYDRQEIQQKIQDKYKNTMNWNTGDEMQLAQVADAMAKEQARRWLQNPPTYNGVVNTNELQRMTLRAQYGTGAVDGVTAGGRASWGAGDQMQNNLLAAADMGVPVPAELLAKAGFDSKGWRQAQQTFQPMGLADPSSWIGKGSYHSMGVGAGEGNTNYGAVYGGDFWDPRTGANGSERMDAMGLKDFMWDKFHNFKGNGYENVKDMWGYTHTAAHNSGRDFVGDPTYGPRQFPGYSGTTSDRRKANQGLVDQYGDNDPMNWRPGRKRIGDQEIFGKYTIGGPIAVPQYGDPGRIPLSGLDPNYIPENSGDYTRNALDGLRGRTGNETNEGPVIQRKPYAEMNAAERAIADADDNWMRNQGSTMDLGYSKKYLEQMRLGRKDVQAAEKSNRNDSLAADGIVKPLIPFGDNVMKALYAGVNYGGLNRIVSPAYDTVSGGAVGAPGRLTTSNDVFDNYGTGYGGAARMTDSQRLNSPFRNFADGFADGRIGAKIGAYTGATAPPDGWALKYSGGRASGGRVNAGRLYSVAERGDELFMPEKAGNVIPFDKVRGLGNNQPPVLVRNLGALPDSNVQVTTSGGQAIVNLLKVAVQDDPRMNAALASRFGLKPRTALSG